VPRSETTSYSADSGEELDHTKARSLVYDNSYGLDEMVHFAFVAGTRSTPGERKPANGMARPCSEA
jgi:hypothetical protein